MPLVLLGCSQVGLFSDKFFGVFGVFLSIQQRELAKAEKALLSRIEVGLMMGSLVCEEREETVKKPLKILGELKKNEEGFVGFSGRSHG